MTALRCHEAMERLVEGLTGSVSPDERGAVVEHLSACARCRDEAAQLEPLVGYLHEAGRFTPPPGFWPEFMSRLEARLHLEQLPPLMRVRRWLTRPRAAMMTAAATAAVVLAISTAVRIAPRQLSPEAARPDARGIVTETMTSTLPSLGEILDIWRAGLSADTETAVEVTERRPR